MNVAVMLLAEFLTKIYIPSRIDLTADSIYQYQLTIRQFNAYANSPRISEITDGMVCGWMRDCLAHGMAPATVNVRRTRLLTLLNCAYRKRLIFDPPRDVPRCRESRKVPTAWTAEELQRLVTHAGTLAGAVGELPANWYWQSMIMVVYETGLRVGAVRTLEVEDFHPHGPALLIRSETQKTLLGQCVPLSAPTAALLAEHLYTPERTLIFPWPNCQRWFFVRFRKIVESAGLSASRRGHDLFHKIRRTNISYLACESLEIARHQAGHVSAAVTQRFYIDPRIVGERSAVDLLPRIKIG